MRSNLVGDATNSVQFTLTLTSRKSPSSVASPVHRSGRRFRYRRQRRPRGFLLIMVLLVISMVSLAALNFSESMLVAHETSRLDSQRFQARMMVESGLQTARLFVASTPIMRTEQGGAWDNPQKFQAINIVPHINPVFRGNVSMIAPSLDQAGVINGFRYGLQNESDKLNLNVLVEIDKLASTLGSAGAALGALAGAGSGTGGGGAQGGGTQGGNGGSNTNGNQTQRQGLTGPGGGGGQSRGGGFGASRAGGSSGGSIGGSQTSALAGGADTATRGFGATMLMGLPGMTEDVADAILDFIDADEEARPYGAEYADYYQQLQPGYKPLNGPLTSIEQLLLVRGVTPQLMFGYDQNRNGYIDASEHSQMMMGVQVGGAPGAMPLPTGTNSGSGTSGSGDESLSSQPGPLGWAPYLTLHSQEKNAAADGTKRVYVNGTDLQQLYDDMTAVGIPELFASYIIAYRIGGQAPPGAGSPLQTLMTAAAGTSAAGGMLGAQLSSLAAGNSPNGQGGGNGQQGQQKQAWTASALESVDLSQQTGNVKINQLLDLIDSSVTMGGGLGGQGGAPPAGGQGVGGGQGGRGPGGVYASPITASPLALADALPTLMDKLTTVESETLPGRINIMQCPREILAGIPGMNSELLESIIQARADGSETENRKFETWLVVEGLVTVDQMRGFLPLMTCGGDVFKAQVIGYFEGSAPYCRAEAIISGVGASPTILFYRRLDHLGRAFDVVTLGQRNDVGMTPITTTKR